MRFPNAGPRVGTGSWQVVVDGDSNSDQSWATSNFGGFDTWWTQLGPLLSGTRFTSGDEFATAGNEWTNLTSRQSTVNAAATAAKSCLLLMCGTNDRYNGGLTASAILTRAQTYLNGVSGFEAIGLMQIPALGGSGNDAVVTTYNAGLSTLTPPSGIQLFVINRPTEWGTFTNATYFQQADQIHITEAAHAIGATNVKAALEANLP